MRKSEYYDAEANSKGWTKVSIPITPRPTGGLIWAGSKVIKSRMSWLHEHGLILTIDYHCRAVTGKRKRFEFWFKDKNMAILFKLSV